MRIISIYTYFVPEWSICNSRPVNMNGTKLQPRNETVVEITVVPLRPFPFSQ